VFLVGLLLLGAEVLENGSSGTCDQVPPVEFASIFVGTALEGRALAVGSLHAAFPISMGAERRDSRSSRSCAGLACAKIVL